MIIDCIIEILKNSDDVYINELGLFEKKRTSSEIQENQISPPQIKVFFDEKGEGNGFAFILKYAEKKQKRINDADVEIRQWIEELKNSLANNKSITFENFGTFSLNPKNEIIFESGWIKELNIDFEGMEPIRINEEIVNEEIVNEEIVNEEIVNEEMVNEEMVDEEMVDEEMVDEEMVDEEMVDEEMVDEEMVNEEMVNEEMVDEDVVDISKKPKKRLTWLVIVIVLILLISVGGYFSYPYLTSLFQGKTPPSPALFTEEETKSPDILPEGTTVFEEESDVIDTIPEEIEIVLQEEQEPVQEKEVKTTIQSSQDSYSHVNFVKGNFYVIAGSFVTEKSAIQHISQHRLQKHNPVLLYQKGNNRVRVCIGTFSTEEEAQRFADQFNRNYWVLH